MRPASRFAPSGAAALCITLATAAFASGPMAAAGNGGKAATAPVISHGKPNSGVVVAPTVPDKIAVGETITVRLQISGVSAADGAGIEVRDPATRTVLLTGRLAQGEQKTIELPYTGRADGMQYLDVTTTQAGRSTVQSVPLRVGTGELKLKPEGQRRTTASGEAVISLPAASPGASR